MSLDIPEKNPRGIPRAFFIENIEEFMKDKEAEQVLYALQDNYRFLL